jgi:anti-anti-sigma factor
MNAVLDELAVDVRDVKLSGPLTARRADEVRQLFRDLARQGIQRVVVDLEDVPFIDSRGLVALIAGYKAFGGESGTFRLVGIHEQPRLVFELTGFDRIFQMVGDDLAGVTAAGPRIQAFPCRIRVAVPDLAA